MKTKWLAFIFGGIATILLIVCIILGIALYQKYKEKPSLPKLPTLTSQGPQGPTKTTQETLRRKEESAKIAPYFGAPLVNYTYKLVSEFPSLPSKLMVYQSTPETFDLNSAKELAAKFNFKGEPQISDGNFTFSEGTTPSTTTMKEVPAKETKETGAMGEEPSVAPQEPEKFTGRELSITKDGYINYQNYAVGRKEVVTYGGEEVKPFLPEGVESKDKAKELALNFLRDKGLLPENYDVEIPEPYGSYFLNFYPKHKGYKIQTATITVEVGNEGKIASCSLRKVKIEDFGEYPIKGKEEALKIETVEYKIEKVELGYSASWDKEGKEYLQPVYIFSGKDSEGNDFRFEIPAVKSEFLEPIQPVPLIRE